MPYPTTKAVNAKTRARVCCSVSYAVLYFLSSQPPSLAAGFRRATRELWVLEEGAYIDKTGLKITQVLVG
jgi:hypothetical protein